MPTTERLGITGYRGKPVPNEFLRREGAADHLAVLLPGFAYSCDVPLFYYAENLLLDGGADVLRVEYASNRRPGFRDLPEAEQLARLLADASAAYRAALARRPYREATLIGKSLGTVAMGHVLTAEAMPNRSRAVWLTPLLREGRLREQMRRFGGPSLLAIGSDDPHHDPALLDELTGAGWETVVVNGADHSLDVAGDAVASVRAVERVVRAVGSFLAREPPAGRSVRPGGENGPTALRSIR